MDLSIFEDYDAGMEDPDFPYDNEEMEDPDENVISCDNNEELLECDFSSTDYYINNDDESSGFEHKLADSESVNYDNSKHDCGLHFGNGTKCRYPGCHCLFYEPVGAGSLCKCGHEFSEHHC